MPWNNVFKQIQNEKIEMPSVQAKVKVPTQTSRVPITQSSGPRFSFAMFNLNNKRTPAPSMSIKAGDRLPAVSDDFVINELSIKNELNPQYIDSKFGQNAGPMARAMV